MTIQFLAEYEVTHSTDKRLVLVNPVIFHFHLCSGHWKLEIKNIFLYYVRKDTMNGMADDEIDIDSYVSIFKEIVNSRKMSRNDQCLMLHNLFLRSSGCKCCKRHLRRKPQTIRPWTESEFQVKHSTDCTCSCRHVSRQICRTLGHDWCAPSQRRENRRRLSHWHIEEKAWGGKRELFLCDNSRPFRRSSSQSITGRKKIILLRERIRSVSQGQKFCPWDLIFLSAPATLARTTPVVATPVCQTRC